MKYLLLAWSQGNLSAQAGQTIAACPYLLGRMREAWLSGFSAYVAPRCCRRRG
ncbi:Rmf/CrpP family protein [Dyella lutea]|uniref:Uncharacterized protein n=1 Tax=Dyella lutea TaxID=2950441 RepID=A0ABT1FF50_9GAMM|nr:Rmf/CrpP family protein [Dyella lutea]MCP1376011.1 hypothetical protein [Dyella lutea]